jgi:hypothetical protein
MTVMRIKHDASNKSGKVLKDGVESRECVFAPVECPCLDLNGTRSSASANCAAMPAMPQAGSDRCLLMAHDMLRSSRLDRRRLTVSCITANDAFSMVMPATGVQLAPAPRTQYCLRRSARPRIPD